MSRVALAFLSIALPWAAAAQAPAAPPPAQNPAPATEAPNNPPPANPPAAAQPPMNPNAPETLTHDEPATFRARVNLVMVPVVVRDKNGQAVGGLHQEDFLLYDRNKPQQITRFSMERPGSHTAPPAANTGAKPDQNSDQGPPPGMPERFVAYVFDDIHLEFGDLAFVRNAAIKHLATLGPTDRAAIYTTSGISPLEFTDDRDKLNEALLRLRPHPLAGAGGIRPCPDISYYMADLIVNKNDPQAIQAATQETISCMGLSGPMVSSAAQFVTSSANQELTVGNHETRITLLLLLDVVRRMSAMPGQRTIVLVSPGFITPEQRTDETEVMDRAIRANVVISSIDARGLYTDRTYDASRPGPVNMAAGAVKMQIERAGASAQADVLAELAFGTGGTFFQNSNDLEGGFKRAAASPDYYYVLGFSPQNLRLDGSFHALKVTLKEPGGLSSQARRGYYAPTKLMDAIATAKEEIQEALFSREEMHDLPVELHTQFFKASATKAQVTVLTHVDLRHLRLRKAEGRNVNNLTIVSALFDRNGNYVIGNQKVLEMRLKDETVEKRADTGFTVRSAFDVKPGTYLVRLVVRDSEGQVMSAANGAVDIP